MRPPSTGPMSPARPHTAPKTPCMRARSSRLKMSPTMVSETGCIAPAPSPWKTRAAMSWVMLDERPLAAEPTRKNPIPTRRIGLRP